MAVKYQNKVWGQWYRKDQQSLVLGLSFSVHALFIIWRSMQAHRSLYPELHCVGLKGTTGLKILAMW